MSKRERDLICWIWIWLSATDLIWSAFLEASTAGSMDFLVVLVTKSEMLTELVRVWDLLAASSTKPFTLFQMSSIVVDFSESQNLKSKILCLFVCVTFFSGFDLLDCWVRLGGIYWVLRWISWFDFLGSEVGLLDLMGSTCLRWVFLGLRFFFCLGWLCCIFGLIWYFGALGFDDFVGVWKNGGFEIYDFVFKLNFLGFFVCLFLKKIFGFASLFAGEEHDIHVLEKKKCSYEKKN